MGRRCPAPPRGAMAFYEIIIFLVLALDSSSSISITMVSIWESNMGLQVRFNPLQAFQTVRVFSWA